MTTMADVRLRVEGMTAGYGAVPVVHDISFEARAGEVIALLGANGAGKTTALLALAGELPLQAGVVELGGVATKAPLHRRARQGLGLVTEERSVFMGLSVLDNLRAGRCDADEVLDLFPELKTRRKVLGGQLSGGEQQMLTLGRALARHPQVLLADELSLGLAPLIVDRLLAAVRTAVSERGMAAVLVEQHVRKVLGHADRVLLLERGRVAMDLGVVEARERIAEIEDSYLTAAVGTNT
jgi:branched-chain amino acid transport system ATP-binding protein